MDAMNLHQQPHVIYNVEETELKLTYNSGNQKLLVVKGIALLMETKVKP
jgi:hypothetical protein